MLEELSKLFDTKTLDVLSEISGKKFLGVREVSRNKNLSVSTVHRIFQRFEEAGLLNKKTVGNATVYEVNSASQLYFLIDKIMPKRSPLNVFVQMLSQEKTDRILLLDDAENRASVMVIGNLKASKANDIAEAIKKEFNYSIKVLAFTPSQVDNMKSLNVLPTFKTVLYKR